MSYTIKLSILLFLLPLFALAQDEDDDATILKRPQAVYLMNDEYRFFGGLVGGVNFTQVDGDTYSGYNKVGLNVGAIVQARVNNILGLSVEINYTQKGSHAISTSSSAALGTYISEYKFKLNYMEIPVVLHILTNQRFHYEFGFSYARLINFSESLYADPGVVIDPNVYYPRNDDFNIIGGLCYQFYNKWFIEGRFQYSLATIRDAERNPLGSGEEFNNVVSVRLIRFFNKAAE